MLRVLKITGLLLFLLPAMLEAGHFFDRDSAITNLRMESRLILNLFLDTVDEGKLKIFDQVLTRKQLKPVTVSHKYVLEEDILQVMIECRLEPPIVVPHAPQYSVDTVLVETDDYGNIIQLTSRVQPKASP